MFIPINTRSVSLDEAVKQMDEFARKAGHSGLVMPPEKWKSLVSSRMAKGHMAEFANDALRAAGMAGKTMLDTEFPEFMLLIMQIWNASCC